MSSFYTRRGDDGTTGQLGEGRVPKHHPRMEALGTLDEASAALGLARALCQADANPPRLTVVQRDLYAIMAEVASTPENAEKFRGIDLVRVRWLETEIDRISAETTIPKEFILPGDSTAGATLALARTVVRRAERRLAELVDAGELENPIILQYINRLSSLCFAMELLENQQAGKPTLLAKS
jgi:cob(I)alamin adenosyltransferase